MRRQPLQTSRVGGVAGAVLSPLRALRALMEHGELWKYVLVPFLINLMLFIVLTAALLLPGLSYIDRLTAGLPDWLIFVEWLLRLLFVLLLLAINGFLLAQFGVALGAPWYSALSARLEEIATGAPPPDSPLTAGAVLRDIVRALFFQFGRLLIVIATFFLVLPLNFIPAVGSLAATVINVVVAALLLSLDFFDPPLDRRLLGFRQKLGYLRRHLAASLALGLVFLALVSVPLLNLLTVPLGVIAGTLLYCDHLPQEQGATSSILSATQIER